MSIKTRIAAFALGALIATGSLAAAATSAEARGFHEGHGLLVRLRLPSWLGLGPPAPLTTVSIMIATIIAVTAIVTGCRASTSTATTSAVFAAVATDRPRQNWRVRFQLAASGTGHPPCRTGAAGL